MVSLFMVKNRQKALGIFALTTLAYVPSMLIWNIWGNSMIEEMDQKDNKECTYNGTA